MNPDYDSMRMTQDASEGLTTTTVPSPQIPTLALVSNDKAKVPSMDAVEASPPTRKRSFLRRGGESQTTLFKAAALAAMSTPNGHENSDSDGCGEPPHLYNLVPTAPSVPELDQSDCERSTSRKRMRGSFNYSAVVDQISSLCVDGPDADIFMNEPKPPKKEESTIKSAKQFKK